MSATMNVAVTRLRWQPRIGRQRGLIVACAVFLGLLLIVDLITPGPFTYFEFSFLSGGGAALALAAMGQTLVILSGGFDLSTGAVVSLVNVVLASVMSASVASQIGCFGAALVLGGLVGALNGFFVTVMRMQSIVVTLAVMFIAQGVTLLVMDKPGGTIAPEFANFFNGSAIPNWLPAPVVVILVAAGIWLSVKNTRFGVGLYAVGSDADAAYAAGVPVRMVVFAAYLLAGIFYGAAGVFVSAQTGAADPLIGRPLLLQVFTAVVLGGTRLGGGRGGAIGAVVGAYTLMIVVNVLLVLNVSAYFSSIVEGSILLLAVLVGSLNRQSPIAFYWRLLRTRLAARAVGALPSGHPRSVSILRLSACSAAQVSAKPKAGWFTRNKKALRMSLPAYAGFIVILTVSQLLFGSTLDSLGYYNALLVLSSFLTILALGQGAVILTGGLDLSVPWMIGFVAILTSGLIHGIGQVALWVIPLGLLIGIALGILNGVGIVLLGLPPIVMTLAMNGILQGIALLYCNGTPAGYASPEQRWFMTGRLLGLTPVVWFLFLFIAAATLLLGRTVFGRYIYAVGNSPLVARLSAVPVGLTLIGVYALSGFCSALVGILLSGFSGQASLGMGDEYLLPSIAVVVVGGTAITGGQGHYLGMLGGVLLLTALSTLLAGTMLPDAVRDIIFGLVVLGAVLALRERRT